MWRIPIEWAALLRTVDGRVQAEIENGVRSRGRTRVGTKELIVFLERPAGGYGERVVAIVPRIAQSKNSCEWIQLSVSLQQERIAIYSPPPNPFGAQINFRGQLSFQFQAPAEGARGFQSLLVQDKGRFHRLPGRRSAVERKETVYAAPLQRTRQEVGIRGVIKKARSKGQSRLAVFRQYRPCRQAGGGEDPPDDRVAIKPQARFNQQPVRDRPPVLHVSADLKIVEPGLRTALEVDFAGKGVIRA